MYSNVYFNFMSSNYLIRDAGCLFFYCYGARHETSLKMEDGSRPHSHFFPHRYNRDRAKASRDATKMQVVSSKKEQVTQLKEQSNAHLMAKKERQAMEVQANQERSDAIRRQKAEAKARVEREQEEKLQKYRQVGCWCGVRGGGAGTTRSGNRSCERRARRSIGRWRKQISEGVDREMVDTSSVSVLQKCASKHTSAGRTRRTCPPSLDPLLQRSVSSICRYFSAPVSRTTCSRFVSSLLLLRGPRTNSLPAYISGASLPAPARLGPWPRLFVFG